MTYAFTMDVPINEEIYQHIVDGLGPEPPKGLIVHLVVADEGRLRYIDVWDSKEDWERFQEERLHPVVDGVMKSAGFTSRPPEPVQRQLDVRHIWGVHQQIPA